MKSVRGLTALLVVLAIAGCGDKSSNTTTTTEQTTPYPIAAELDAAQEVPKPKGADKASGDLAGTIRVGPGGGSLDWRLELKGLTGPASAAQIYLGAPRKVGVLAVSLCTPCANDAHGSLGANAGLLLALVDRPIYVNVQTKRNPKGEIRGRITVTKPVGASGGSG